VIAAQLAKIGIVAKIQNVEWAQWLSGTYGNKNYDLTLISHVEPFDLGNFAKPDYYWNYESPKFNEIYDKINNAPRAPPIGPSSWATRSACWPMTRSMPSCSSRNGSPWPRRASAACGRTCRCS
jgi:ABC-type transport system substrate-binding protein